jgi:hypothetical protein
MEDIRRMEAIGEEEARDVAGEAEGLLETWGHAVAARYNGGNPLARLRRMSGIGNPRRGDSMAELIRVCYVESTMGFHGAKPVLKWVYAEGRRIQNYQFRRFGESWLGSLMRHGWIVDPHEEVPPQEAGMTVLARFRTELECRLEAEPLPEIEFDLFNDEDALWKFGTYGEVVQYRTIQRILRCIDERDWARASRLSTALKRLKEAILSGDPSAIEEAAQKADCATR